MPCINRDALLPLSSSTFPAAVVHSGYFDELPNQIGRFPALLKEENKEINGGLANFRNVDGICDDEDILEKWTELVETSTRENGKLFLVHCQITQDLLLARSRLIFCTISFCEQNRLG